jgi:hypothetical protein
MTTGNDSLTMSLESARATAVKFAAGRVIVQLADGREVRVPLSLYPTLERARPTVRLQFELIGAGKGISWPALDLDLSTAGILAGLPERIPAPPHRASTRQRTLRAAG